MLKVTLPDGSTKEFTGPVSSYDVAAAIGPGLAKAAVVGEVDGRVVDLHAPLPREGDIRLRLVTKRDPEALPIMWHSCAHVMAQAVMRLYDGVQLAFGPTTDSGFSSEKLKASPTTSGRCICSASVRYDATASST